MARWQPLVHAEWPAPVRRAAPAAIPVGLVGIAISVAGVAWATRLGLMHKLDTLVVDALRYKPHPTHASVSEALRWIERLKPRRAVLTNLHVDLDYASLRAELPAGVEPAFDGMELEIAPSA